MSGAQPDYVYLEVTVENNLVPWWIREYIVFKFLIKYCMYFKYKIRSLYSKFNFLCNCIKNKPYFILLNVNSV